MVTAFLCERCFYPIRSLSFISGRYARGRRNLLTSMDGMVQVTDEPGYPRYFHPLCYGQHLAERELK